MIVNAARLHSQMQRHAATLLTAPLVASEPTAFESWFRAELAYVLLGRAPTPTLSFNNNYPHPDQKCKPDICITQRPPIAFELKSFVAGADANKIKEFPVQNLLLEKHVQAGNFIQGVSFATFSGYSPKRLATIFKKLYINPHNWTIVGPTILLPGKPMQFSIATATLLTPRPGSHLTAAYEEFT